MSTKKLKKPIQRPIHQYSDDSLKSALNAIRENGMSIRAASRNFGVPRGTIQDRLHGRVAEKPRKMGPMTVLTQEEEQTIVDWLIALAKVGFGRKKSDLLNTVEKIIKNDKRNTPFKDGRPGNKWYSSFLKRHPILVQRTAESITMGRAVITEEYIRSWFRELYSYLSNRNALDILDDPSRIMNGDETSFSLCPNTGKVIGPKGWKNIYDLKMGNEKETITVLLVFTADGRILTPMVIFPYIRPPKQIINSMPQDWFLGKSESGWMKSDVFFEYVANKINTWIDENQIKKPILLFIDGHKSHLTLELSTFCDANGIILYALPPNTTHIMQPADVSVFRPLKSEWKKTVRMWQNCPDNLNKVLTKTTFCPLLATVFENAVFESSIKNGFMRCGLFPFNPNNVDYSKCVKNSLENFNNTPQEDVIRNITEEEINNACKVIMSFEDILKSKGIDATLVMETIKATIPSTIPENEYFTEDNSFMDIAQGMETIEATVPSMIPENEYFAEDNSFKDITDGISYQTQQDVEALGTVVHDYLVFQDGTLLPLLNNTNDPGLNDPHKEKDSSPNLSENSLSLLRTSTAGNENNKNECTNSEERQSGINNKVIVDQDVAIYRVSKDFQETPISKTESTLRIVPDVKNKEYENNNLSRSTIPTDNDSGGNQNNINLSLQNSQAHNLTNYVSKNRTLSPALSQHLFWPSAIDKGKTRKRAAEKLPSAISSSSWRDIIKEKQDKKNAIADAKTKRKIEREKSRLLKQLKQSVKSSKSKKHTSEKHGDINTIRKGTRPKKPKLTEDFVYTSNSSESEMNDDKKLCARCEEILESDAEEDALKNLGCDICPLWYHLKCTYFREFSYETAACKEFICESCS